MSKKAFIYFTLGEVVALEDDTLAPNSSHDIDISTIMATHSLVIEESTTEKMDIFKQLMRMVYARFYHSEVCRKSLAYPYYTDAEAPDSGERKEVFRSFVNLFNLTSPRFIPLLKQFNDNASDPIGKITSTSTGKTRFNDTPQDGGEFDDDEHTSHITQTEATTESDTGSIVERLDALYRNWREVLRDWTSQFKGLFYGEEGGL